MYSVVFIFLLFHVYTTTGNCKRLSVTQSSAVESSGYTDVTIMIQNLIPIHGSANRIRFHIWTPVASTLELNVSTRTLYRVREWRDPATCASGQNRFQTARLSAYANFTSGSNTFRANILSLISDNVSPAVLNKFNISILFPPPLPHSSHFWVP